MFTRLPGISNFSISPGVLHAPKPPALPTAPHPVVLCFLVCFLLIDFLLSIRGASLRNIVAALRLKRSLRSLFLHLGAMPSSATGGGIPPRPTAPHPVLLFYFILLHLLAFCFQSARFPQKHSRGSLSDRRDRLRKSRSNLLVIFYLF